MHLICIKTAFDASLQRTMEGRLPGKEEGDQDEHVSTI